MTPLARAQHSPELLDAERHDPAVLAQSLAQVAAVNRWLGGASALLRHVLPFLRSPGTTTILDVGTGSADLPRRVADAARSRACSIRIIATDVHPQMRAIAQAECAGYPEISIEAADALHLPFADGTFDLALLSLTLHHFEEGEQERVLQELARVARRVIVNELRRNRINYLGAKLLAATVWRGNPLTRHDGPLSVLRAFTPGELRQISARAGAQGKVYTHFFQRVVLVVESANSAAVRTERIGN